MFNFTQILLHNSNSIEKVVTQNSFTREIVASLGMIIAPDSDSVLWHDNGHLDAVATLILPKTRSVKGNSNEQ